MTQYADMPRKQEGKTNECGAASGLYDTEEKAIEAWNRRYGDA